MATFPLLALLCAAVCNFETSDAAGSRAVAVDVAIIGGGSSGTYCAVRLQQMGKIVALVEKENRLGGHVNTFVTSSGQTFDYGTQGFVNTANVRRFFASLNTPLAPSPSGGKSVTVDMRQSLPGPDFPFVSASDLSAALEKYKVQLAKYPNLFLGYHLPDPVPDDLLLSWGDFLKKYDLEALAYNGFLQFQGSGNILDQPTLYIMKLFNPTQVEEREQNLRVHEANGNTQALFDAAQRVLGRSAILGANIKQITRTATGVEIILSTSDGDLVIVASKMIITIPPKLELLNPFLDVTLYETALFSQWTNNYYYDAVLADTGLPTDTSVFNYGTGAYGSVPTLPGVYFLSATGVNDFYTVQYCSPSNLSDDEAKTHILEAVVSSRNALKIAAPQSSTSIAAFNNHSPFALTVSTNAIKSGFYKQLNALQGLRNTFWTGGTWSSGSSNTIWDFNESELLPQVVSSLRN